MDRSGSKNSFPAGQKRPHAGQGDRRAGLADQPGRVQPHPQTGDGRHHQRLHRHPEPPGRPRICGRLISLSVAPSKQDAFLELLQNSKEVLQCYHVTGAYTFLVKVSCGSMPQLEHLILQFQKLGTTSTQIILSTPVNHGELDALML